MHRGLHDKACDLNFHCLQDLRHAGPGPLLLLGGPCAWWSDAGSTLLDPRLPRLRSRPGAGAVRRRLSRSSESKSGAPLAAEPSVQSGMFQYNSVLSGAVAVDSRHHAHLRRPARKGAQKGVQAFDIFACVASDLACRGADLRSSRAATLPSVHVLGPRLCERGCLQQVAETNGLGPQHASPGPPPIEAPSSVHGSIRHGEGNQYM